MPGRTCSQAQLPRAGPLKAQVRVAHPFLRSATVYCGCCCHTAVPFQKKSRCLERYLHSHTLLLTACARWAVLNHAHPAVAMLSLHSGPTPQGREALSRHASPCTAPPVKCLHVLHETVHETGIRRQQTARPNGPIMCTWPDRTLRKSKGSAKHYQNKNKCTKGECRKTKCQHMAVYEQQLKYFFVVIHLHCRKLENTEKLT